MSLDNHYYNLESDSKIKIKYKFSTVFHFTSEPEVLFVIYLSNMGGLLGLWFGLSFIDISLLIKSFFFYIKIKLNIEKIINKMKTLFDRFLINEILLILLQSFKRFLIICQRLHWRAIISLLTFPIILMQLIDLIETYLQFSTQIDFDSVSNRGIDNKIPINIYPAVMFCSKFLFDKILFHPKNLGYFAMMSDNDNISIIDIMNNNNKQSNYEIAIEVILKTIDKSDLLHDGNSNLKQLTYDHVHSIINFKNYQEFEQNFELTHNKNISGFDHIFKDLRIFKSVIEYTDYGLGESKSEPKFLPMITPLGQCLSYYKGEHKKNVRIDQIGPDTILYSQRLLTGDYLTG